MEIRYNGEHKEDILIPEQVKKLFLNSFRYSQGHVELQQQLFTYLHTVHPEWRISDNLKQDIVESLKKPVVKFVATTKKDSLTPHQTVSDAAALSELESKAEVLQRVFSGQQEIPGNLMFLITSHMLNRDHRYMTLNEGLSISGRPNRPSPDSGKPLTPLSDPYLSHICYYGLQQQSTGMKEYDDLFTRIVQNVEGKGSVRESILSAPLRTQMSEVVDLYNQHHPQNPAQFHPISL